MFRISFEKRYDRSRRLTLTIYLLSLILAILAASLIFPLRGVNPLTALQKILLSSFFSSYGLSETITKAIPLILISSGLCLAYRAKLWNIGSEGQLLAGCILATWTGLNASIMPSVLVLPLMFMAGMLGGALFGMLAAWLKHRFCMNEVISTLMLNYVAIEAVQYLIYGPWKGKTQWGFPYTDNFPVSATLGLIPGTRIHYLTLTLGLLFSALSYFLLSRTTFGFEIRLSGENQRAADRAGISPLKVSLLAMGLSGGLAGLAGTGELCGIHHHLTYPWAVSSGYGFTAIIVAWISGMNPLLCILSSIFFGGLLVGGDAVQISLGLPFAVVNVFNGVILFFLITGEFFLENRIFIRRGGNAGT
ncbi:MAG: ABC transporter permease [Candidatus Wallbacteria bacterium]|nr:ABC transporter permease [Candidatus Wallbacteria bacterium]